MEHYLQNYGQFKTVIDGNIIDDTKWNAIYDGDVLDLEAMRNDESLYIQLNNHEIQKLFEVPSYNRSIVDRLEHDLHNPIKIEPIIIEQVHHPSHHKSKHKSRSKSRSKSIRRMRAGRPPVHTRMAGGMIKSGTVVINLPHHNKNLKRPNKSRKRTKSRRSRF